MKKTYDPREYIEQRIERITESGCWIWMQCFTEKYGSAFFGWKYYPAHRLAWIAFHGPIADGMLVCHRCDIHLCCNPDHLFLGTHRDNMRDMTDKQRQARGERHGSVKLTEETVKEIRGTFGNCRGMAKKYGVSKSLIHVIQSGQAWKHLT